MVFGVFSILYITSIQVLFKIFKLVNTDVYTDVCNQHRTVRDTHIQKKPYLNLATAGFFFCQRTFTLLLVPPVRSK